MTQRFISIIVRANHMLALVTCTRAARLWHGREMSRAGSELRAAARYAEDAAQWLGGEFGRGLNAAATAARAAGAKLEAGGGCSADEIDDVLIALRSAIDSLPRFSLKQVR